MITARTIFVSAIVLTASLLLSGCTPVNTSINFSQTFEGYPCDGRCDQFRSGFETGRQRGYTSPTQCRTLNQELQIGCLSYIHEYQLQANQPAGYVF